MSSPNESLHKKNVKVTLWLLSKFEAVSPMQNYVSLLCIQMYWWLFANTNRQSKIIEQILFLIILKSSTVRSQSVSLRICMISSKLFKGMLLFSPFTKRDSYNFEDVDRLTYGCRWHKRILSCTKDVSHTSPGIC